MKDKIPKYLLTAALLAFVVISVAVLIVQESRTRSTAEIESDAETIVQEANEPPSAEGTDRLDMEPAQISTEVEPASQAGSESTEPDALSPNRVVVHYFHGNVRCRSCVTIERFTREAVFDFYDSAIENGNLEWHAINIDEPANQHFINDYELFTRSVIVSEIQAGEEVQWKNLDRVWSLLSNEGEFKSYIRDEIGAWMEDVD